MALLLPENIASRSGVPSRLRRVAAAFRDFTPESVTVWLRETDSGLHYLVVLDPAAGVMVIDAPPLPRLGRLERARQRVFGSLDVAAIGQEVKQAASALGGRFAFAAIEGLAVECVWAAPELEEVDGAVLGRKGQPRSMLTRAELADGMLEPAVKRLFGAFPALPLSENDYNRARAVINPQIVLTNSRVEHLPLFQDPQTAPEQTIKVMDREQERVAEHLGPGYRVLRGVAGSGKTLVLAHRARHLQRLWPHWRILILCFNRVLAGALAQMVPDQNVTVTNVDRLAYQLAQSKGKVDFDQLAIDATAAARLLDDSKRYDAVLVDEAQDFDHAKLNLAYAMLKAERVSADPANRDRDNFVVAFDVAQNVYRRGGARWNPPGLDAQGRARTARGRSTVFRKNYRNTREIVEFAMTFLQGSSLWASTTVDLDDPAALVPPEAARRSGPTPRVLRCRDLRSEAETIADATRRLADDGLPLADIAVLYGCEKLAGELCDAFEHRALRYFQVKSLPRTRNGGEDPRDAAPSVRDAVRLATLTNMKGLEFSRVFVGGVNHVGVGAADEAEQLQTAKSRLYAAMTRAMDELVVTVSSDGPIGRALFEAQPAR